MIPSRGGFAVGPCSSREFVGRTVYSLYGKERATFPTYIQARVYLQRLVYAAHPSAYKVCLFKAGNAWVARIVFVDSDPLVGAFCIIKQE